MNQQQLKLLIILGLFITTSWGIDAIPRDAALKIAFIYNFLKYAELPTRSNQNLIKICLINPSTNILNASANIHGRIVKKSKIHIETFSLESNDITSCNLLFAHDGHAHKMIKMPHIVNSNILTISDADNFAAAGGMIGFIQYEGSLKFEINLDAVRHAGIKLSSQLLKLAHNIIDTEIQ